MAVSAASTVADDAPPETRLGRAVEAYLAHLAIAGPTRSAIRARVLGERPRSVAEALERTRDYVDAFTCDSRCEPPDEHAEQAGVLGTLRAAFPTWQTPSNDLVGYRGASMPPLARRRMAPPDGRGGIGRWLLATVGLRRSRSAPRETKLGAVVRWRQLLLALLIVAPALAATTYMATVLPHRGSTLLELVILTLAFLLFSWILVGFWTAVAGFLVMWRGDRYGARAKAPAADSTERAADARTAIVMPIYEEAVDRTFAGLRAIYESIARSGRLEEFEFFILSDSAEPSAAIAEENAWAKMCRDMNAFDRIFYRRRRARVSRKAGNLADFCRRWGAAYEYMIVLDADSILVGSTAVELVDRMDANPSAGLIQTPPTGVNRHSFLARIQQFSMRAYGPMFAAGLHYWHLDKAHYWGHNAIIRVAPFMDHCALPSLSGHGPLGGDILSHDFVEAAFMRRAGWGVHIAYDLGGSYEEVPPTLLDELGRDRRWCQGNIQHLRLLFADNLSMAHRALFANGVMAYGSAAIWFVFLLLSSLEAVLESVRPPNYFSPGGQLFPHWPVWEPFWAVSLFTATMIVLFLPKVLGVVLIVAKRQHKAYGGIWRLIGSTLVEVLLTSLLAPIRMLAHSRFVATTLLGRTVTWKTQHRTDATVAWSRALRYHAPGMVLALLWGGVLIWYTPGFAPWFAPILAPLILAPLLTVLTSRVDLGRWLARLGLAQTPEESQPPIELVRIHELEALARCNPGFAEAIVDPTTNALTAALIGRRTGFARTVALTRENLAWRALASGPSALSAREQRHLLSDFYWLRWLHASVWANAPAAWATLLPEGIAAREARDDTAIARL